jgi:disulfide bond formation protein DsbB
MTSSDTTASAGPEPKRQTGAGGDPFLHAAWLLAVVAMLGSLFFGEVMKLTPCSLCWYQRICLFPLTAVLAAGIVLHDERVLYYSLPLVLAGLAIAVYHNLLDYDLIAEELVPCTEGVPCSARPIEWLGFVTIPLLSLLTFASILACLLAHRSRLTKGAA